MSVRPIRPIRTLLYLTLPLACAASTADQATAGPEVAAADPDGAHAKPVPTVSEDPVVQKVVELGRRNSHVHAHLRHLTEKVGPRLTSSHALMEAEIWARNAFAAWGLEARLERWGEFPVGFDRGPWSGGMVAPENEAFEFTTMAWTPGIFGPVRGPAIAYPNSVKAARALGERLENAWIVHAPAGAQADKGGKSKLNEKTRKKIDVELRKGGIAGHVVRSRDREGELVHTGGRYKVDWNELPKDVRINVKGKQFDALVKRMGSGGEIELEFSVDNRFFKGPVPQYNVVADIKGTEKPDEYVVVGGHLDSWDGARGAVDNGTGVSTTMEAARLLMEAGAKPKRTIRFMLWSGEEQGLLGSRGYVDQNADLMPKISAVLVHDAGTNYLGGLRVTPEMVEDLKTAFDPVSKLDEKKPFALVLAESLQTGGSDHTPFIEAGVPGLFWIQDGRADYRHAHHTQHDNLDAAIEDYQKHSALVVAIGAYNIANLDNMLDRTNSAPLKRRRLGAELDGMVISEVTKGGAAKRAGLRKGDEIVEIAGVKTERRWGMFRAMQRGGPKVPMKVKRKGKTVEITLDYTDSPAEKERAERRAARKVTFGELEYGEPAWGRRPPEPKKKAKADDKADGIKADEEARGDDAAAKDGGAAKAKKGRS